MPEVKVTNRSQGLKVVHTGKGSQVDVKPGEEVTLNLTDEAITSIKAHPIYKAWQDLGELVFEGIDFDHPEPGPVVQVKNTDGEGGEGEGGEGEGGEGEGGEGGETPNPDESNTGEEGKGRRRR